jgi:pyruvate/2-oxoglutarate dehydrogenase complex dihydrolipoamide acyltransferase (E2) component
MPEATWEPHEKHGRLTTESDLPASVHAFPKQRKEPLTDAEHVRNAVARLDVSDKDRDLAFANIRKAARHYGVNLSEGSWHDLRIHRRKRRKAPPDAL